VNYNVVASVAGSWAIAGAGDFNGDGRADILWRDAAGNFAVWLMDGFTIAGYSTIGNIPAVSKIALGDFDGDGKTDIVWRDASGSVIIRLMSGYIVSNERTIAYKLWSEWSIAGTGDLNGDGNSDILWRDSAGNLAVWMMDGFNISSYKSLGNVLDRKAQ
jgi:hypothetical protein